MLLLSKQLIPTQGSLARRLFSITTPFATQERDLIKTIKPGPTSRRGPRSPYQAITPVYKNNQDTSFKAPPLSQYYLHVHSTRNNTILTLTDPQGRCLPGGRVSSGMLGFKNVQRSTYEAGHQCAIKALKRIEEEAQKLMIPSVTGIEHPGMALELVFDGFGQGRDALSQALLTTDGNVVRKLINRLTDRTPIKIGGTRSKKTRRL